MTCKRCGADEELRFGFCFDCANDGETVAAHRTVLQHLRKALHNVRIWRWDYVRFDVTWAIQRLTRTGAYKRIAALSEYVASKGKRYSSHYATILNWERKNGNGHEDRTELLIDEEPRPDKHTHSCGQCDPRHDWPHDDPF